MEGRLSEEDQAKTKELVDYYAKAFPRVNTHLRIGLRHLQGQDFKEKLNPYMRPLLIKGVPSVMSDLKEFYS